MFDAPRNLLHLVRHHPLSPGQRRRVVGRMFRVQVSSRLMGRPIVLPFVGATRLYGGHGMTAATLNYYCGLHEFEDMALVIHALRPGDLFIDVGANVGTYTVLASGVAGAKSIAFEPIPTTYQLLEDNIHLNRLTGLTTTEMVGVGQDAGRLRFTIDSGVTNHVLIEGLEDRPSDTLPVVALDDALHDGPTLLKIDVEGWELAVLRGSIRTLESDSVLAILVEVNASKDRYGVASTDLDSLLGGLGFHEHHYRPVSREIERGAPPLRGTDNRLYVRDADQLRDRVRSAAAFHVSQRWI